jgi:hypothetical protein
VKWRVSTRPEADTDLREARDWYEQQRPGLGDEFLLSMADAFTQLVPEKKGTGLFIGVFPCD